MTLSCHNQSLDIKTSSQRCLPLTSDDSNSLQIHSKVLTFQILISFRAVNISENGPKFFTQFRGCGGHDDPILINQSLDIKTSSQRCLLLTSENSNSLQKHSKVLNFQILFSSKAVNIPENAQSFSPNPRLKRLVVTLSYQNQ